MTTDPNRDRERDCPFCREALRASAVAACRSVLAVPDAAPVAPGHMLVITRRHVADLFDMTPREVRDAMTLLAALRAAALRDDPAVTGFNIGANCGRAAGQRIMHAHIHFIPRRATDPAPGRAVKGVIRNRMAY